MKTIKRYLLILVALLTMTAGAWAQDTSDEVTMNATANANEWTLTMPDANVELEVTYKTDLTLTLSLTGWTYGATANTPTLTGNTGSGDVTYSYKVKDAADDTYSATVPTDAGNYTVRAIVAETDDYADGTATADFTIGKATPTVTAPTALTLNFTGTPLALVTAGETSAGTMQYSLDNETWSTDIPTATDEGTYTVYYKVVGNDNYNDVAAASIEVTIGAAQPIDLTSTDRKVWTLAAMPSYDVEIEVEYYPAATLTAAPTSIGEVDATGSAQGLVTGGSVDGGTFEYALGTNATTAPTEGWSADVPTATAPATYYVWYKVVGDDEHSDSEDAPACLTATISGFPVTIAAREYVTYYSDMALTLEPSEQDAKLYTITAVGTGTATATEITSANREMPFLIYNGAATEKTVILVPTTAEISQAVAPEFKGTLVAATIPASTTTTDSYAFNGKQFVWVKNDLAVGANRCWLEVSHTAARALSIGFDDNTTGIVNTNRTNLTNGDYYDLNGRKVAAPDKKGVYIQNGKKVVIK